MGLESHIPSLLVLVWGIWSALLHTTVVLGVTLMGAGTKAKFSIRTCTGPPEAGDGAIETRGAAAGTAVACTAMVACIGVGLPDWVLPTGPGCITILRGALP